MSKEHSGTEDDLVSPRTKEVSRDLLKTNSKKVQMLSQATRQVSFVSEMSLPGVGRWCLTSDPSVSTVIVLLF